MAKTFSHDMRYDGATIDQVATMLADQAFREEVCEFQHVTRHDVSITPRGEGMSVRIDQVQAARGIPGFATKFVGDEINIVQEEEWSSPSEADLKVTIPGKPGDMVGTVRLREVDGGVTETVEVTVKVGIPLVGGKIEGLIADLLIKALKAENKVGRDWLSR